MLKIHQLVESAAHKGVVCQEHQIQLSLTSQPKRLGPYLQPVLWTDFGMAQTHAYGAVVRCLNHSATMHQQSSKTETRKWKPFLWAVCSMSRAVVSAHIVCHTSESQAEMDLHMPHWCSGSVRSNKSLLEPFQKKSLLPTAVIQPQLQNTKPNMFSLNSYSSRVPVSPYTCMYRHIGTNIYEHIHMCICIYTYIRWFKSCFSSPWMCT